MFNDILKKLSWISSSVSCPQETPSKTILLSPLRIPENTNLPRLPSSIDEDDFDPPNLIKIPRTQTPKSKPSSSFLNTSPAKPKNIDPHVRESICSKHSSGLFKLDHPSTEILSKNSYDDDVLEPWNDKEPALRPLFQPTDCSTMKFLNIPDKRASIFERPHDLEVTSDIARIDNISDFSLNTQKQEILSEKNDRDDKDVNVSEIIKKLRTMNNDERRKFEKTLMKELLTEELPSESHYLISTDWMAEYTQYLNKTPPFLTPQSIKPINNAPLLDRHSQLRDSLVPNINYILVNPYIWQLFTGVYGGGPAIRRDRKGGLCIEKRVPKRKLDDDTPRKPCKPKRASPLVGLLNKSNYCFLNSCLQCLFSFDSLSDYFLAESYKQIKHKTLKKPRFVLAYTDALKIIKSLPKNKKKGMVANLSGIQKLLRRFFDPGEQQDIHEFLRLFLSEMQEELTPKPKKGQGVIQTTIIEELFEGECLTRIICRNCQKYTEVCDKFMDFSLAIKRKKHCSIYDCLNRFFTEDGVIDCYKCEACGKKSQAIKSSKVVKTPKILVVHFKRFKIFPKKQKIYDNIDFPVHNLDLTAFCSSFVKSRTFTLKCFATHLGNSDFGHYMAYCEREGQPQWYLFNDENVKSIERERLSKREAYLLFYIKNEE